MGKKVEFVFQWLFICVKSTWFCIYVESYTSFWSRTQTKHW